MNIDCQSHAAAFALASVQDWRELAPAAGRLRDLGFGRHITYSRKVFVPLTRLCRDVCHYCTFATKPSALPHPFLSPDEVMDIVRAGAAAGCKEVLFTLGDRPEARWAEARTGLNALGYASTLHYLEAIARRVVEETGLLPHLNPGLMDAGWVTRFRKVAPSLGIMLESASERLCEKGGPHFGSPDKLPARRLATIDAVGVMRAPLTTGILVGIGETRTERIASLLALRESHERHGHIQEVIIQNFRAKFDTKMRHAPEPGMDELCWTVAAARLILGAHMSLQAPPNLYTGDLVELLEAGVNDWGGVSPITPDHVNPEAPWPHLAKLAADTERGGKILVERLTVYPRYIEDRETWLDPAIHRHVLSMSDAAGLANPGDWFAGTHKEPSSGDQCTLKANGILRVAGDVREAVRRAENGESLRETEIVRLFEARRSDFDHVCAAADQLRERANGELVTYVVNRNINYTNICLYRCGFCAFSKGSTEESLRGKPYVVKLDEIRRRVAEAWERGATEVCLQGGIHPSFTGRTYLDVCEAARDGAPDIHIHAFSPLEIDHGAKTLGLSHHAFLRELKASGLNSLPGTAAEILDDEIRGQICPDKLDTKTWLDVVRAAHGVGLRTTATIMFGHVEGYRHWARHLLHIRALQQETGGFTEFVPLPFVHHEAPLFLKGRARKGPTLREALLMHAVARLALNPVITNIQASWVKLGPETATRTLMLGVNDLGGTLMNESISRAAGASHGQELSPRAMEELGVACSRPIRQRTTLYGQASEERRKAAAKAPPLVEPVVVRVAGPVMGLT